MITPHPLEHWLQQCKGTEPLERTDYIDCRSTRAQPSATASGAGDRDVTMESDTVGEADSDSPTRPAYILVHVQPEKCMYSPRNACTAQETVNSLMKRLHFGGLWQSSCMASSSWMLPRCNVQAVQQPNTGLPLLCGWLQASRSCIVVSRI